MTLNLDLVGQKSDETLFTYEEDTVMLYALGIGAGRDEPEYVYEKRLKVIPSFAVVPIPTAVASFYARARINLSAFLHAGHKITLHRDIAASGTFKTHWVLDSVYDKGDYGAILNTHLETRDAAGNLLFENKIVGIDRSAGNFGGDPGPKTEKLYPPQGQLPDFSRDYQTTPEQAILYRLSGDKNPHHVDQTFAEKAGLERPILHGLCTYGFACRALLRYVCKSESDRLKSFSVRFMNVVFPGEKLTIEIWDMGSKTYFLQVKGQDGRLVLGNASAVIE